VYVADDIGNTGLFAEADSGIYYLSNPDFNGKEGRKYILHIELNDGRQYRSDSCLFMDVPPIENLDWQLAEHPSPDHTRWLQGIEFRLDTRDPENRIQHYLWTYDETWESAVPFPIRDRYLGNNKFEELYPSSWCYLSDKSSKILIESTEDQDEALIRDYPLIFISNESSRFWRNYSIIFRQFGLSEEAYFYHKQLNEMTSQTGSIFDKQPFTLKGNIRNEADPTEFVGGYFIASGVSSLNITLSSQDLPDEYRGINPEYLYCMANAPRLNADSTTNFDWVFERYLPRLGLTFVGRIWEDNEAGDRWLVGLRFAPDECTFCQGTTKKPDDWD
jgi:hypothetical protein